MAALTRHATEIRQLWSWLDEVLDPEIPVVSVVELGIVRDIRHDASGTVVVTVTPTYSGCPATAVIALSIELALQRRGIAALRLETRLSPAWTTDWISAEGRRKLREYGIAPPAESAARIAGLARRAAPVIPCPRCGSTDTEVTSQFGSTACKALHRCLACREPFDYFKCH